MTHPLTNALAMRTAAVSARWEDHVADNSPKYLTDWQRGLVAGQHAMRHAILALPGPTDDQLLAEAVKLPEVLAMEDKIAQLEERVVFTERWADQQTKRANDALTKIGEAK